MKLIISISNLYYPNKIFDMNDVGEPSSATYDQFQVVKKAVWVNSLHFNGSFIMMIIIIMIIIIIVMIVILRIIINYKWWLKLR